MTKKCLKKIDISNDNRVRLIVERILLSRDGGGTGPRKPGNLLNFEQGACLKQGKSLNDKSERDND